MAFLHAVGATAGYALAVPSVDDDSIDVTLSARGRSGALRSPKLDIQLKCTASVRVTNGAFPLALPLKNYDDLRASDRMVPCLLVVVVTPRRMAEWVELSDAHSTFRRCTYWCSLRGLPEKGNTRTVSVRVRIAQRLDVRELQRLMQVVGAGGAP